MTIGTHRDELVRSLTAYVGRHLIVRSRDPFLAQIDTLTCTDQGVSVSGTLLCVLNDRPLLSREILAGMINRRFRYAASWDMISADRGSFFARYATWGFFYDQALNDEISRRYSLHGATPEFTAEAANLIDTWRNEREARRAPASPSIKVLERQEDYALGQLAVVHAAGRLELHGWFDGVECLLDAKPSMMDAGLVACIPLDCELGLDWPMQVWVEIDGHRQVMSGVTADPRAASAIRVFTTTLAEGTAHEGMPIE